MDWLPELICCDGEWDEVQRKLYAQFKADFIESQAMFKGLAVRMRFFDGDVEKQIAFWHLISEGDTEDDRTPDFRRCERIGWIRAILDHADDPQLMIWQQSRNGKISTAIALPDFSYIVFLAHRDPQCGAAYVMLLTAYCVEGRRQDKYRREYEAFQKTKNGPKTDAALPK